MTTVPHPTSDVIRSALVQHGFKVSDDGNLGQCPTHDHFDGDPLELLIGADGSIGCLQGCEIGPILEMLGVNATPAANPDNEWPSVEKFDKAAPPLPLEGLPDVLKNLVIETAEAMQVPTDMVLNHAIGVLSSAPYGTVQCEVKRGWVVPLQMATMTLSRSGEKKSPTNNMIKKPISDIEKERRNRDTMARVRHAADLEVQAMKVETLKANLKTGKGTGAGPDGVANWAAMEDGTFDPAEEYRKEKIKLSMMEAPQLRWSSVMDDITPEALGIRLGSTYTGAGLILSDETTIFAHIASTRGGASKTDKAKTYLQATSGDVLDVGRVGREGEFAEQPALSMALMLQPDLFEKIVRANPELVSSGLVPRFLLVNPKSRVGYRKSNPDPVSEETEQAWHEAVTAICRTADEYVSSTLEERARKAESEPDAIQPIEQISPRRMQLSLYGQSFIALWQDKLEPQLRPQGRLEPIASWCSKSQTYLVQLAALFTLLDDPWAVDVDDKYLSVAEKLLDGYVLHQLAMSDVAVEGAAEQVWARLTTFDDPSKFEADGSLSLRTVRRLVQSQGWYRNTEAKDKASALSTALETLEDRGLLRVVEGSRKGSFKVILRPQ